MVLPQSKTINVLLLFRYYHNSFCLFIINDCSDNLILNGSEVCTRMTFEEEGRANLEGNFQGRKLFANHIEICNLIENLLIEESLVQVNQNTPTE